jgi:plasmid segregation protein ParM
MIAIDIGYSSVKGLNSAGQRVYFPSVIAPASENLLNGAINGSLKHTVKNAQGREYWVGEAAMQSSSAVSTLSREKPAEIHDLLVATAAYLLHAEEGDTLAVGLPISYYRTQRQELQRRILAANEFISVDSGPIKRISFGDIRVYPQGLGVLFTQDLQDGLIGVLDIGYLTTDYLLFSIQNGQPMPIIEACGSVEIGVSQAHQRLAGIFHAKTGINLPIFMQEQTLTKSLQGQPVKINGKEISLTTDAQQICQDTARQIEESVKAKWRDRHDFTEIIYGIGGGCELLRPYFSMPQLTIQSDPVWANAQGFLIMS